MIVTVTLNPTCDIITPLDKLIPGRILRSKNIYSYPAGKGTNTARALSVLGAEVTALGFTGSDNAAEMDLFMKKYGVKPDFIPVPGSNRICLIITGKNEETVINSESNILINIKHRRSLFNKLKILSEKAGIFIFSGSLPLCLPQNFYAECIETVRDKSMVILDTSGKYLREGVKARPHILKINIHELESAFNVKLPVKSKLKFFIKMLSEKYGIKTVIVTLNEKGSVLFNTGLFHYFKPFAPVNYLSPVGSGDAYSAGLAYGIERKMNLYKSCRLATACAAANIENYGACFFPRRSVNNYLKR